MLKTVLIVIAVLVIGVLAFAASKPDTFRIARSTRIQAPPDKVFALINDFHRWQAWSPYEKKDPDMKREFSGSPSGPGAAYAWDGDRNIGAGQMRIVESCRPRASRCRSSSCARSRRTTTSSSRCSRPVTRPK
jgi:hypothetical protein